MALAAANIVVAPGAAKALRRNRARLGGDGFDHFFELRGDPRRERPSAEQSVGCGKLAESDLNFVDAEFAVAAVAENAPQGSLAAHFQFCKRGEHDRVR